MNKEKAIKAIESFRDSTSPVVSSPNDPATKGDLEKLSRKIAELAEKLVESISD